MHRALALTLTSIALTAGTLGFPACAESIDAAVSTGGKMVADTAGATKTSASKPAASTNAGARLASIIVGSVVGIPVSMVRKSKTEIVIATKELVGDHKWLYPVVSPISIPGGIVSGIAQGFMYGPYNAWHYADQPFSAEAFSLGETK